jgi:hypothetical protein
MQSQELLCEELRRQNASLLLQVQDQQQRLQTTSCASGAPQDTKQEVACAVDADATTAALAASPSPSTSNGLLGLFKESTKKLDSFLSGSSPARPPAPAPRAPLALLSGTTPVDVGATRATADSPGSRHSPLQQKQQQQQQQQQLNACNIPLSELCEELRQQNIALQLQLQRQHIRPTAPDVHNVETVAILQYINRQQQQQHHPNAEDDRTPHLSLHQHHPITKPLQRKTSAPPRAAACQCYPLTLSSNAAQFS